MHSYKNRLERILKVFRAHPSLDVKPVQKSEPKNSLQDPEYIKLNLGNSSDEEKNKILNFMASHYQLSEMSLEYMQKEMGMPGYRISLIFSQKLNTSFKKYLNSIRISEAKRLLRETDRPINNIAYNIGFINVTHFNRVFKKVVHETPHEYRNKWEQLK